MRDAVGEDVDELDRVDALPDEVRGVEVDRECVVAIECVERAIEGVDVVCDLGGVDLEGEADALFLEGVEDGCPAAGKFFIASVDLVLGGGGKEVELVPDGRAGEAVDDVDAELPGLPSPQMRSGRIDLCLGSIGSLTAWPTRWLLMA